MSAISKIRILWGVIILLVLTNILVVFALWTTRSHKKVPFKKQDSFKEYLENKLKLSPEQKSQFEELKSEHFGQLRSNLDSLRIFREQLMDLMKKQEFNEEAKVLIEKIGQYQMIVDQLNFQHFREVLGICNEEQKEILIETMKKGFHNHSRYEGPRPDQDSRKKNR